MYKKYFKVNSGISDSEFKFEILNGAIIKDFGEIKPPEELSLEEAREKASFKILNPEYMRGYIFSSSMVYNNREFSLKDLSSGTVALTYTNEKASTGITESVIDLTETVYENQLFYAEVMDYDDDIKINGIEGKYISIGDMKILT
jgi:hypothetical protein